MTLREMIHGASDMGAIAAYLDGLSHDARLAECYTLGRKDQKALYEKAAASEDIDLQHFVPEGTADLQPVIHYGINTLPLFRKFQKRFCLPAGETDRLFGYNEGFTRPFIGPGYFVAHDTKSDSTWQERGAIVVDYFLVPDGEVAAGWPRVKPNSSGLQMFVYNKTRDFMRKVSDHVSIGAAFKKEKAMGAYFVLCREA